MCVREREKRGGGERKNVYMIKPLHYKNKNTHSHADLTQTWQYCSKDTPIAPCVMELFFRPGLARSVPVIDHVHTHTDINTPAPAHSDASC